MPRLPFYPPRIRSAAKTAIAVYFFVAAGYFSGAFGKPLDTDFVTFWAASKLSLSGRSGNLFDLPRMVAAEHDAVPASVKAYAWHYPPTFQLAIEPLSLLPYLPALLTFVGLSLLFYLVSLRRLWPDPDVILLLLAYPGAFVCVLHGQNSLISAALFACALGSLTKGRPGVSGLCFGLLSCKPQLVLLVPLALLASRQWRALATMATAALTLAVVATAAFGVGQWQAFFHDGVLLRRILEQGLVPWEKMPTAYVFLRWTGLPSPAAYIGQVAVACCAVAIVVDVYRRPNAGMLAGAVLVAASLLVSPFLFDYEMAILAVPMAILARDMACRGADRAELVALGVLFIAPLFSTGFAKQTHLQIGFFVLAGALALCCRRAYRHYPPAPAPPQAGSRSSPVAPQSTG